MKVTELKKLYEQHTKDGVIDFEAINEAVNEHVNGIVTKSVETSKTTAITDLISGLGLEGVSDVEALKGYADTLKKTATTKDSELTKTLSTLKELETQKAEFEGKYKESASKLTVLERKDTLRSKDFNVNPKYLDHVLKLTGELVSDDKPFDVVAKEFLSDEVNKIYIGEHKQGDFSERTGGNKQATEVMKNLRNL